MPFILSHISKSVSKEQETRLKSGLGRAISLVPGKSEQYLLCGFEDNAHLYLRGDDSEPAAYIEAAIFGNESHAGYDEFTAEVCRLYNEVLDIAPDHIYIRYSDIPDWGVAGINFDRNRF